MEKTDPFGDTPRLEFSDYGSGSSSPVDMGTPRTPSRTELLPKSRPPGKPSFVQARIASDSSWSSRATYTDSDSRYISISKSRTEKFSLSPDPNQWGADLSPTLVEDDDYLHNPDPQRDAKSDRTGVVSRRGFANLGCITILCIGLIVLFAGYPVITYFANPRLTNLGGFNLGGINASGQVPSMSGNWGLIDLNTPADAYTKPSWADGSELELVFSDEFNLDGRTFYPGDDPYWEAVDLHYWGTNNLEWYDPAAVTTVGGNLQITLSKVNDITENHNLSYRGGMIASWNKFCFTGGYIETSVSLPGANNIVGFWPAIWTMGNLGRAGYGASLEGMWPYTYDACDVGTAPNQTVNGLPVNATTHGDYSNGRGGALSYLPGQRLSRCTCDGESHPGPKHSDGSFVGRGAPEIDIFEAQITGQPLVAQVSQSAQWAPYNYGYFWYNTTENEIIVDPTISQQNTFTGNALQQAASVVTATDPNCYTAEAGCFSIYGFQYQPGFDNAYVTWISNNKISWTMKQAGFTADPRVEISGRPVPQEPMYIIMNLGMSENFGVVDLEHLPFPSSMLVDYVRVYQPKDQKNVGCNPKDFPTTDYINTYIEAYTNPNLTTWVNDYHQPFPKNKFLGQC